MKEFIIHTDGGCSGNPGPGAWAYVMRYGSRLREASGFEAETTNNKMELQAVIEALAFLKAQRLSQEADTSDNKPDWMSAPVKIFTDSLYVKNGITSWIHAWKQRGWKTADKKPVKNLDLWIQVDELTQALKAEFHWVEGHAGNPDNERCDTLVGETMAKNKPSL